MIFIGCERPLRLGIDIDGVLADFNRSFVELVKLQTGIELTLPPQTWSYHLDGGVTVEQDQILWTTIAASGGFWQSLDVLVGASDFIDKLIYTPHDIYFITTRPGRTAKAQTEYWLRTYLQVVNPTVLVSKNKGAIACGLELDLMLDDKPENLFSVKEGCPNCHTILLRTPYNAWAEGSEAIDEYVNSLEELQ